MVEPQGRNPVILTVDFKGNQPSTSQSEICSWVQRIFLLLSWPWPIVTHRHFAGWITMRLKGWKLGYQSLSLFIWQTDIEIWNINIWLKFLVNFSLSCLMIQLSWQGFQKGIISWRATSEKSSTGCWAWLTLLSSGWKGIQSVLSAHIPEHQAMT